MIVFDLYTTPPHQMQPQKTTAPICERFERLSFGCGERYERLKILNRANRSFDGCRAYERFERFVITSSP